ncbi:CD225/dispanin family protein, partial [Mycobacterium kansasii]
HKHILPACPCWASQLRCHLFVQQTRGLWAQGRYAEAQAAADSAKKFVMWSAIAGVVVIVIYGILMAVGALNTGTSSAAMLVGMF